MSFILKLYSILSLICFLNAQVSVLSPGILTDKLNKIDNGEIRYQLGNFGQVPYGKTIVGTLFYAPQPDGSNYWCDFETTSTPPGVATSERLDYAPIFFVEHSTDCQYTTKAKNVKNRGGKIMLLAYDSNVLSDEYNVDDKFGEQENIPTVIITKDVSDVIRDHLKDPSKQGVIMSIKFSGMKRSGNIDIDLFFRSDDVMSLNFFKEFAPFKIKLGSKLQFTPIYKYNIYVNEETSDEIEGNSTAPCTKSSHYCVSLSSSNDLRIQNPRYVLLENLRQSCIYKTFAINNYWNYMVTFTKLCADPNNPSFNPECSKNAIKLNYLSQYEHLIDNCMKALINTQSKIEEDYDEYNKRHVYKIPELMFNGVKYRGSWFSKTIMNSICEGFMDDPEFCSPSNPQNIMGGGNSNAAVIVYVSLTIVILMFVVLCCYRRVVKKSLETSLNERIQEQAMKTIGQYNAFKDKGEKSGDLSIGGPQIAPSGGKLELVSN